MSDLLMAPSESKNFCDNIELKEFNQIQAHGGLLVLNKKLRVIQYSENVVNLLDTKIEQLLNSPVSDFLESENINENIIPWLMQTNNRYKRVDWKSPQNKIKIWICAHQMPEGTILEIEPLIENDIEDNSLFDLMQHVVDGMKLTTSSQSIQKIIQHTCNEIQKITGFDRVMVYQFDQQDDSGVVVGEAITNKMESYLGLHFPASDIPLNVRAMYLKLSIRYIPTIDYKLEKIHPETNPISKTFLNLSTTALRMVAPVHIQYLKNMGVKSAISIAIIHNNKLWGLIACHHKKPKYLSVNLRLILMLIGNTLGIQIESLACSKEYLLEQKTASLLSSLTENIYKKSSLFYALNDNHQSIMELIGSTGISIYFQNNLLSYGKAPKKVEVMALIEWLNSQPIQIFFASSSLPTIFEPSTNYKDKACGILVIPLARMQSHYLIFYRPEISHSIFWAGNPSESLKCEGKMYSPRHSFERFMQNINNHAATWTTHDIKVAEYIQSIVVNKQLQDLLQVQAMHDPLTGLLNRLYLNQRLEIELARAERKSENIALILTDIDLFKRINDGFGHQAGDYVLSEFANFLKNCFRGYDYIYRYGGEEFLILLPDTNAIEAMQKAEKLRCEIKKLKLIFSDKKLPVISISAGIAVYPINGSEGRSLISSADVALYKAKATGRDKVIIAVTH